MNRKRRHACRVVEMRKLDRPVMMAGYTQDSPDWRKWLCRRVSLRTALRMVADGEAKSHSRKTENGLIEFYQETQPTRASRTSPATLTLSTMLAASGECERRAELDKLALWPFEHDRRNAATVGPRVDDRLTLRARQALDRSKGIRPVPTGTTARFGTVRAWYAPVAQAAAA